MIRFFRWILGYIEFELKGGFLEGFINECFESSINISNLDRNDNTLYGIVSYKHYKRLNKIAIRNGGKIEIIKSHGPIFAMLKIKDRYGIFVGIVVFIFIVNFLTGFIWDIDIVGNESISEESINQILRDNDFVIGKHWSSVNRNNIENYIMATFDDCSWVHINRQGTTAIVEIRQAVEKPNIVDNNGITNLKASKDGIIVDTKIHGGWQVANVGDSVKKGDILATGIYESEINKKNIFAHASGIFMARVVENIEFKVNRIQENKVYEKTKKYRKLQFYNLKLPLYIGSSSEPNCDIEFSEKHIKLFGKSLPIGIITKTVYPYTVENVLLSDKELNALAQKELEERIDKEFSQYEIISKNIDISLDNDGATVSGHIECIEDIGYEVKIKDN